MAIFSVDQVDYLNDKYPPGEYRVTITGTAGKVNLIQETTTFDIKLVDPCDPPSAITAPGLIDQVYVLGD